MTETIHIDFETRSELDLSDVGPYKYAVHPSTEILCMAYAIDDAKPEIWIPGFSAEANKLPEEILDALGSGARFEAHNAEFEWNLWNFCAVLAFGWPELPIKRMSCSAVKAAMYSLPRKLEKVAEVLRLTDQKDMGGHSVMFKLAKPRNPSKFNGDKYFGDAQRFDALYAYCKQDVATERALSKYLKPLNVAERRYWLLDQRINARGICIDVKGVEAAHRLTKQLAREAQAQMVQLTNGAVESPTEIQKIKDWAASQGCVLESLAADKLPWLLESAKVPDEVKAVLRLRDQNNKSSTAKLKRMLQCVHDDGRIRNILLFYGAHTGRWTGKLVQTANLPQGKLKPKQVSRAIKAMKTGDYEAIKALGNPPEVISSCLRGFICASPGKELICADYASIEARMVLWLAGETEAVSQLEKGVCLYRALAARIYGVSYDEVTDDQRQNGKRGILGCGYGMGWHKLQSTAARYGAELPDDLAQSIVTRYRDTYPKVKKLWNALERAAISCLLAKKQIKVEGFAREMYFGLRDRFLLLKLPSGRILTYCDPALTRDPKYDNYQVTYMGVDSVTKQWRKQYMWGGVFLENVVQAIARDVMAYGMLQVEKHPKYEVLFNVYDEVLAECNKGDGDRDEFRALLTQKEPWASDCPIEIKDGDCWVGKRYRK